MYRKIFFIISLVFILFTTSCENRTSKENRTAPLVGFLDFVQDPTIELARKGFEDALRNNGFSEEDGTVEWIYTNAQGDIPTLNQACELLISRSPDLIATNVTLSTITTVRKTKDIPIFMIVSPRPDIAGLSKDTLSYPENLFGVYETLAYIDTAINMINDLMPDARTIGTIYNQSEPQSVDAFEVLSAACKKLNLNLVSKPVTNSSESQLVTQALLNEEVDVFFALPDNVIFASFETIEKNCSQANVPIFTSESGLVSRGALASYGADFYQWGYQCGEQASAFLLGENVTGPEEVIIRKRIFNPAVAEKFGIEPNELYQPIPD